LTVNVIGCLLIGFLSQLAETRGVFTSELRSLLFIGLLGGFTTFSTFGNESMNLLRDREDMFALANILDADKSYTFSPPVQHCLSSFFFRYAKV